MKRNNQFLETTHCPPEMTIEIDGMGLRKLTLPVKNLLIAICKVFNIVRFPINNVDTYLKSSDDPEIEPPNDRFLERIVVIEYSKRRKYIRVGILPTQRP